MRENACCSTSTNASFFSCGKTDVVAQRSLSTGKHFSSSSLRFSPNVTVAAAEMKREREEEPLISQQHTQLTFFSFLPFVRRPKLNSVCPGNFLPFRPQPNPTQHPERPLLPFGVGMGRGGGMQRALWHMELPLMDIQCHQTLYVNHNEI